MLAYLLALKWLALNGSSVHAGRAKYKTAHADVGHLNNEERETKQNRSNMSCFQTG